MRRRATLLVLLALGGADACSCDPVHPCLGQVPTRAAAIPGDVHKGSADNDFFPPVLRSSEFEQPVPMPGPITTAGAEDSPFHAPDGSSLVFFFAPDVRVPVEEQVRDCTVGLWRAERAGDGWSEPERLLLSDDLAMDGCPVIQGEELWFCSVRTGNRQEIDVYRAELDEGAPSNWRRAEERLNGDIPFGEWHLTADGSTMYYGASGPDSLGDLDLYSLPRQGDGWGEPRNLGPLVNGPGDQAFPYVTPDGAELYFGQNSAQGGTGPAVWRSLLQADGSWGAPEEIVSNFAGEPNLDADGNLIFVHHYMTDPGAGPIEIVEADLYIARRVRP